MVQGTIVRNARANQHPHTDLCLTCSRVATRVTFLERSDPTRNTSASLTADVMQTFDRTVEEMLLACKGIDQSCSLQAFHSIPDWERRLNCLVIALQNLIDHTHVIIPFGLEDY